MTEINDTMPDGQLEPTEANPTSPTESLRRARRPDTDRTWPPPADPRGRPQHDSIPGADSLLANIETRPPLEAATHAESEGKDAVDYATVARPAKRQGGSDLPAAGIIVAMTEPMPRPVVAAETTPLGGAPGRPGDDARGRRGPQPTTVVGALRVRFSRRNVSVGTAALLVGSAITAALLLQEPGPRRSTLTSGRMPEATSTTAVTTATMVPPPPAETAATALSLEPTSTGSTSSAAVMGVDAGVSPLPPPSSVSVPRSDGPSASSPLAAEPNKDTPNAVPKPVMPSSALPTSLTAPPVVTAPGTQSKRERIKDDGPRSWQ